LPSIPRPRLLALGLALCWVALAGRAFHVQVVQHAFWRRKRRKAQRDFEKIPALRGEIRSSDGQVLAKTVHNWSLGVDPAMLPDSLLPALAEDLDSLGLVKDDVFIRKVMARRQDRYILISRDLLPETRLASTVRRHRLYLNVTTEPKRLYPLARAGGAVVGLVGREEKDIGEQPLGGLEQSFDDFLRGEEGKRLCVSDASDTCFQGIQQRVVREPRPGCNLELTLHSRLQEIASGRLEEAVRREGAKGDSAS